MMFPRLDAHHDGVAEARQGLVDGVVHNLVHQVVQPPGAGGADVHARALAHGLQAFQHLDLVAVVGLAGLGHVRHFVDFQCLNLQFTWAKALGGRKKAGPPTDPILSRYTL